MSTTMNTDPLNTDNLRWLERMAAQGRFDYMTRDQNGGVTLWRTNPRGSPDINVGGIAVPTVKQ